MAKPLDLRRQPFGKWLVLNKGQKTAHGQFWVCQCACNPAVTVELVEAALVEGWTRSCGCDYVAPQGIRCPRRDGVGQQVGQRLVCGFIRAARSSAGRGIPAGVSVAPKVLSATPGSAGAVRHVATRSPSRPGGTGRCLSRGAWGVRGSGGVRKRSIRSGLRMARFIGCRRRKSALGQSRGWGFIATMARSKPISIRY